MEIGEEMMATILARPLWNETAIQLVAGERYRFDASGEWTDWFITCGAAGYASRNPILTMSERLRRAPSLPWFALVGSIGRDRTTAFLIGAHATMTCPRSGTLCCFANDIRFMYWNNRGAVDLAVTRLA